jgi:hypothetical protein
MALLVCAMSIAAQAALSAAEHTLAAPAPLVIDPIFGNAGDPTAVYNHADHTLWIFYTQRRAGSPAMLPFTWYHGAEIGLASSPDGGQHWFYRGTAEGLNFQPGRNTHWAPDVIWHDGRYHMFVTFLQGIPITAAEGAKGGPDINPRLIVHYTSTNLMQWTLVGRIELSSDKVIDPVVQPLPDGTWRMWYKDEHDGSHIWAADSRDLNSWKVRGAAIVDRAQEGPFVFRWYGRYWMICDWWEGLGVYHSDDADKWTKQAARLLDKPGTRRDDKRNGCHCSVITQGDRAFIFYQCGAGVQAAELKVQDGVLTCDRDAPFDFNPQWSLAPEFRGGGGR